MRLERRLEKAFTVATVLLLMPNLFAIFGNLIIDLTLFSDIVTMYFTGLFAASISIY